MAWSDGSIEASHSARGAWIETINKLDVQENLLVALREGCVDRNLAQKVHCLE